MAQCDIQQRRLVAGYVEHQLLALVAFRPNLNQQKKNFFFAIQPFSRSYGYSFKGYSRFYWWDDRVLVESYRFKMIEIIR